MSRHRQPRCLPRVQLAGGIDGVLFVWQLKYLIFFSLHASHKMTVIEVDQVKTVCLWGTVFLHFVLFVCLFVVICSSIL